MIRVTLTVNGRRAEADIQPRTHLGDFLREQLNLTGTHLGCEHGVCGACTVEMNGGIVRSCITLAAACDGADIRTIEGFDGDAVMARLREAFSREHALQCGYCTPGMLIAARDLVLRKTALSEKDIRREMSGNLCRCTGYMGIIRAIQGVMAEGGVARPAHPGNVYLGPAPGPDTPVFTPAEMRPAPARAAAFESRADQGETMDRRAPAAIKAVVGPIAERGGFTELPQYFILPHAPEDVWALMSDLEAVAAAMPGAELDAGAGGDRIGGRMSVRLGPMRPSFTGEATVRRDDALRRIEIEGTGRDKRSASAARGRIVYALTAVEGGSATRVDVTISYKLSGMLAQFGRAELVRDVVQRLGEAFAANIDARLSGRDLETPGSRQDVNLLSLVWSVLARRFEALLRRLFGSKTGK